MLEFYNVNISNVPTHQRFVLAHAPAPLLQVQPATPYRSCGATQLDVAKGQFEFQGIPALMRNSASMVVALGALILRGLHHEHAPSYGEDHDGDGPTLPLPCDVDLQVEIAHNVNDRLGQAGEGDLVAFRENGIMAPFSMITRNMVALGLQQEIGKHGTILVNFNPETDKICRLEYNFDVMSVWRQMQNAVASRAPLLAPTSIATLDRVAKNAYIVTSGSYPWRFVVDAGAHFSHATPPSPPPFPLCLSWSLFFSL